jgi:hypothetical protein
VNKEIKVNTFRAIPIFTLMLFAFALSGCNPATSSEVATSTSEIPVVISTEVTPEGPVDRLQAAARDAALTLLQEKYPALAPPTDLVWGFENITQEGLVGSSKYQYTAEGWKITIHAPVVAPDAVIYDVEVVNEASTFRWTGKVDANGQVTEISSTAAGVPVVGWFGYVKATAEGAQFDDYVVILPEGVGEFGIEGVDDAVEAEIRSLRDKEEHEKYAHFWGTLNCEILDYGGCQLLVTRIRSGIEITDPEPIEGWEGTIIELFYAEPGAPQPDDAFILAGNYPVQYGISSIVADTGFLIYKDALQNLRDTDQLIKISGQLICGLPDQNGCQIQVDYLEVDGMEVDPYAGWSTYVNEFYGYQFRYPIESTITERGPDGFPAEELPEGMTAEAYLEQLTEKYSEQLCVSINYSYGYINILSPTDSGFQYTICGRTGVGAGELIDKTEEVYIAGETYTAKGFEFIGSGGELPDHNETLVINLKDGTRVEFGARPVEGATYEDYLMETKLILLQILSTYEVIE